ncbi:Dilute domain-containing protein [Fulvia fulva]|uniref:Dilute domain-containing protein n=1 Tax=Passalora fulva TaxID=5499 RepID=A0A9Q8UU11_PASFU|nr:Dilute domain-containing protein [Fulvia fulva]UJO22332.1 Dilute domain-containing protein [Fulvia fulva]
MDAVAERDVGDREKRDSSFEEQHESDEDENVKPRGLPSDLPRTLDDRKNFSGYKEETEYYDAWQGQSQFLSAPTIAQPLNFNLSLNEPDDDSFGDYGNDDERMAQFLASQARRNEDPGEAEEDQILNDERRSPEQKTQELQLLLSRAARNGETARVQRLARGAASQFIDIDAVDADGSPPLLYASCFGYKDAVITLLNAGAEVDSQDRNQWTALMWAISNGHKDIAKTLLDHGASTDAKSSSGRTALDFVPANSEMLRMLQGNGYSIGSVGASNDFYDSGFSQDRFEEELAESEQRRRMMMESAINLEVDLGNLGLDENPESEDDFEDGQDFVWDKCLHDQMFVFMENDIERILDIVVTKMTPQRTPSQKPVPANLIFLGARYAHYHADKGLLADWLESAQDKIYDVVDRCQWDMTMLAFWASNVSLLLHYLKKDTGLTQETTPFQAQMSELIHEIYILIIRDAERRMDKVLNAAVLDHETIQGFEDVTFQNEWKFLKKKKEVKPEPAEKRFRPPSPKRKAQPSPRNITSLLSSTLFVLDLYDVHSVITAQILSQLYYWLSAEIFNRIMSNKRYLSRTKAMQIRMNISTLEDWARTNNRQPEHYENGNTNAAGETTVEAAKRHLAPVVQLLQWLQCFSSIGDDQNGLETTLQQLPNLHTKQLLHAVKHYRAEVGEKTLSRPALRHIQEVKSRPLAPSTEPQPAAPGAPQTPTKPGAANGNTTPQPPPTPTLQPDADDTPENNLMNPALLLPFHLPTSTDMLISYGAGFGGVNKERERRYTPSVPAEFLTKLDPAGGQQRSNLYENAHFSDSTE